MPPQLVRNSGTHGWLQSPPTLTLEWMDGVHSKKALICKILCKIFQITIMKTEKACSLLNISIKRFHAMLKSMYYYILFMWSSLGFPLVRGDWGRRPPSPHYPNYSTPFGKPCSLITLLYLIIGGGSKSTRGGDYQDFFKWGGGYF